jgi:hypothetical protein
MESIPAFLQYGAFGLLALVLVGVGYGLFHYIRSVEQRQVAWDEHDRERRKARADAEWKERMEYIAVIKEVSNALSAMTAELQAHEERTSARFQELIKDHQRITSSLSKRGINGP